MENNGGSSVLRNGARIPTGTPAGNEAAFANLNDFVRQLKQAGTEVLLILQEPTSSHFDPKNMIKRTLWARTPTWGAFAAFPQWFCSREWRTPTNACAPSRPAPAPGSSTATRTFADKDRFAPPRCQTVRQNLPIRFTCVPFSSGTKYVSWILF